MNRSWKTKFLFAFASVLLAVYFVMPNFTRGDEAQDGFLAKILPDTALRLGLDLQGGIHMVLGIDLERALINESETLKYDLQKHIEGENLKFSAFAQDVNDPEFRVSFDSEADIEPFKKSMRKQFPILEVVPQSLFGGDEFTQPTLKLHIRDDRIAELEKQTVDQALETLRNRLDEFGVAEPSIVAKGKNRIIIQLPGMDDPDRAREILAKTAQLEFQLVDTSVGMASLSKIADTAIATLGDNFDIDQFQALVQKDIPEGREMLFEEAIDPTNGEVSRTPYLLIRGERISGELLDDARLTVDEFNMPAVLMRFNPTGTKLFSEMTKVNVGKQMAIVLDNKIVSAPVLRSHIPNGVSTITFGSGARPRSEISSEAQDLALVLRSGALPAPIEVLENRTVGPSLGKDSIEKGMRAIAYGVLMVIVFMMLYYRKSGLIADMALAINLLFVIACLGMLNATLTLPGIAGILVSVGMAVDANIIIFERIREELRTGRPIKAAIELGYERAHSTILDSNLTTVITGVILFYFGTGPIKGFAVTLIFGLIANYITALWFTRLAFDWMITRSDKNTLSI